MPTLDRLSDLRESICALLDRYEKEFHVSVLHVILSRIGAPPNAPAAHPNRWSFSVDLGDNPFPPLSFVAPVPDSSFCAKCGRGPILDADWPAHAKACQGIDVHPTMGLRLTEFKA